MRLNFTQKLLAGSLSIIAVLILVLGVVLYQESAKGLNVLGKAALENTAVDLRDTLELQNETLQQRLNLSVNTLENAVEKAGGLWMKNETFTTAITNQVTKKTERVEIPTMMLNAKRVYGNFGFVDSFSQTYDAAVTIFQVLPGKLLRISTNVKKLNGERAVDTFIPADSPVYQTVMNGETFKGRATVVGQEYVTAYKPYYGDTGDLIAVLFVGVTIVSPELTALVEKKSLAGEGYAFVYNNEGRFLIHPKLTGKSVAETAPGFWEAIQGLPQGLVEYGHEGNRKYAYIERFEPWDWNIAMSIQTEKLLFGVDTSIMWRVLIIGVLGLIVAGLATMFLIRRLMRPLKGLSAMTRQVAAGDLDATFEYGSDDAIGEVVTSVNTMVGQIKEKLGFSQGILEGLTVPTVVTDENNAVSYVNRPCLDLLGHTGRPEDYIGADLGRFFYGDNRETLSQQAMREGKAITGVQVELVNHKSETLFLQLDAAPLYDLDGELTGSFAVITDLTDIKAQQQRIEAQNEAINQAADQASDIADQVASASEELSAQVEQSTRGTEVQQQRTGEAAAAMQQMNATVLEVAQNASHAAELADASRTRAEEGADVVRRVVAIIDDLARQAEALKSDMTELGEQAQSIGNVITVIEDIADQTNLLALNAAIEAARAGDAGRGFAVVADEVRKLAEKTMSATHQVGQAIQAIQASATRNIQATEQTVGAIEESTRLADESGRALSEIVETIDQTADQVRAIAAASEEQSAASDEIANTAGDINRIASETADAMSQSATAVSELAELAQQLKQIMDAMRS
jgi:methyl-accepting chemotaxis protein